MATGRHPITSIVHHIRGRPTSMAKLEQRTRSAVTNNLDEAFDGKILTSTSTNDAAKLWNGAPDSIKNCVSIHSVKKCIKAYTATLPL